MMTPFYTDNSFDSIRREVDQVLKSFLQPTTRPRRAATNSVAFPAINIWEEPEYYLVESELPGMTTENVEVVVVGNELTLTGEKKSRTDEGESVLRSEIPTGRFQRTIQLPVNIQAETVEARFKNGVLSIRLPKAESSKPKRITISSQ